MEGNLDMVKSGEVTNAVRDTTIDGQTIKKDDFMGIVDGKIVNTAADVKTAAIEMVKQMLDEDSEIVTILYGSMVIKKLLKPSRKPFWPLMTN